MLRKCLFLYRFKILAHQAPRSMDERMTAMEHSLEQHRQYFKAHRRQMEEHMRYVHDFNAALSQRFSTRTLITCFPIATYLAAQSRNAGDDDVDMGPDGRNEY